ncbi:hypothetical protein [Nocardia sp. NPDC052112]|uniref:hypothetical protein n=1 Tax=Nocardia sp. NPDC052112 TaxID=3155646 RepID=UPI003415A3E3
MSADAGQGIRLHDWRTARGWEPNWDPAYWSPQVVFRRCRGWISASRRRRWTFWILVAGFVLVVFPGVMSAFATAQTDSGTTASSVNSATSWMDIHDSSGVPLSNYMFVTNHGSLLHPGDTFLSAMILVIFAPWSLVVITWNWVVGKTFSFGWLDMIGSPLQKAAENMTNQIATPVLLALAVTIGAIPLAIFIIRGYPARAVAGLVAVFVVAVLSPLVLEHPLEDVVSSSGLLAQGRNIGITVAAGINGDNNPDPTQLVATMQAQMVDNYARRPLQVVNYGHVVDEKSGCKSAWSAGMMAGSEDQVKSGLKSCGDSAAYAAANNPSWAQFGGMLLLLLMAIISFISFGYMSIRVIWTGLDAIYYGFLMIFGFAAGGYIYGPTQTWTIRCAVHAFYSAALMATNIIFSATMMLLMNSLFEQV